jgi:HEPN domain-containing protein
MVKKISKSEAGSYLRISGEFLDSAIDNMNKNRFNAAGFDAIQSVINANDALTFKFLGQRASKDHKEANRLHVDVIKIINDNACRSILKNSLEMRADAGYTGRELGKGDARTLVNNAIKFLEWVKRYVK